MHHALSAAKNNYQSALSERLAISSACTQSVHGSIQQLDIESTVPSGKLELTKYSALHGILQLCRDCSRFHSGRRLQVDSISVHWAYINICCLSGSAPHCSGAAV